MLTNKNKNRGFTLVEMTVSLGLFTIIMFIATNGFLSVVNSDRKSRSVRVAADNLNVALEDMSRRIKTGTSYYCGNSGNDGAAPLSVRDCLLGSANSTLFFTDQSGQRIKYTLDSTTRSIFRSVGAEPPIQTTSAGVTVDKLNFIVMGSAICADTDPCTDKKQPMVVVGISGSLGAGVASTTFNIQTTITQRVFDN